MKTSRQSFVLGVMGTCVAGILSAACGSDDEPAKANNSTGGSSSGGNACTTKIGTNHGHIMAVSAADIAAGVAKEYDITGDSPHSHTVSISADDFKDLTPGSELTVDSSAGGTNGHVHEVTITC